MKILYLSCHSIHEYDEVRILHELGYHIYIPGRDWDYKNRGFVDRPVIDSLEFDEEDCLAYHHMHQDYNKKFEGFNYTNIPEPVHRFSNLTKEFVDRFDVIIVMSLFRHWIHENWDVFKDKTVIWRTNGQSSDGLEDFVGAFKKDKPNLKILRYSPTEKTYKNYSGEDAMIRFAKKPEEWCGWTGKNNQVISLSQNVINRAYDCSWDIMEYIGNKLPFTLYGQSNDGNPFWSGSYLKYEEILEVLKSNKVYFYNGTKPANYTLNFMEAWLTGIPVVALGKKLGNRVDMDNYEVYQMIENGVDGFYSDDKDELVSYCRELLDNDKLANNVSKAGRQKAIQYFGYEPIKKQWKEFLESL